MRSIWVALAVLLAGGAQAQSNSAPRLDPTYRDHAVIQRDRPIRVTGSAEPGETVQVAIGTRRATARAARDGRFAATFPAMPAGGPFTLTVTAPSGAAEARDVLLGDVFLCSGQSNMELPVERAQDSWNQIQVSADDQLRLLTIAKKAAVTPQVDFADSPAWAVATPTSVAPFSAACFYMAQEIRKSAKVPVGAIHSSWGGSAISAWMGDRAQRAAGRTAEADLVALYARDPAAAGRAAGRNWEDWWRKATGDAPGREPWQPDAALGWAPVPRIGFWEEWGVPALAEFNGLVWFRNRVTLTAAQARQSAVLELGTVDDIDQSWVNGRPVGGNGNPSVPRRYELASGTLAAGANTITVAVNDVYARGGMTGPAEAMMIRFADGSSVPLATGWDYAVERRNPGSPPRLPWDDIAGTGTLYNAMIAPFGQIGLKGAAWYQGESDVGIPGYARRLAAMMADWRRQTGNPDLPFAIVSLADYGTPATAPGDSGWAALREEQRQAAIGDEHAALALAIDLGDPLDIHPGEKHEVGRRLARAMRALAYGADAPASGPAIAAATRTPDGGVALRFAGVTGALATRSSDRAIGFELCGTAGDCRYAAGQVARDTVTLAGDGRPVARVRYAWADSPVVNLFDGAALPAGPFEIAVP